MSRARNAYAAPAWAAEQRVRDVGSKAVLLTLANYADEDFTCFPGQDTLAEETEQSVRQVRRQVAYLESLGVITRTKRYNEKGKRTSDRYVLNLDVVVIVAKDDPRRAILSGDSASETLATAPATEPEVTNGQTGRQTNVNGSSTGQSSELSTTGQWGSTTGQPHAQDYRPGPAEELLDELPVRTPSLLAAQEAATDGSRVECPPYVSAAVEEPLPVDAPAAPAKRTAKRATPAPATFPLTAELRLWAEEHAAPGLDVSLETEQFLDFHRAKGTLGKDWVAGWRTWMRNTRRYHERDLARLASGQGGRGRQSVTRTSAGLTAENNQSMAALFGQGA